MLIKWLSDFFNILLPSESHKNFKRIDNNPQLEISEEICNLNSLIGYQYLSTKEWGSFTCGHLHNFYTVQMRNTTHFLFADFYREFYPDYSDDGGESHPCVKYYLFNQNQFQKLFPLTFNFNKKIKIWGATEFSGFLQRTHSVSDIKFALKGQLVHQTYNSEKDFWIEYFPVVVDGNKFIRFGCNEPTSKMYNIGEADFSKLYYEVDYEIYLKNMNRLYNI